MKRDGIPCLATRLLILAWLATCLTATGPAALAADPLPDALQEALERPLREKQGQVAKTESADGIHNQRAVFSRDFRKVDDSTFLGSMHVSTATSTQMITERRELTLKKAGGKWIIAEERVVDTHAGLYRWRGYNCYPFDEFLFDREGLRMSATNGGVCVFYLEGGVTGFSVVSDDMSYEYVPPEHLNMIRQGHDFYALHEFIMEDHERELLFEPDRFEVNCERDSCEELLAECFTGLVRLPASERTPDAHSIPAELDSGVGKLTRRQVREVEKSRRENPFQGFNRLPQKDNRFYVARVHKSDDHAIGIYYDNWQGFEVTFFVQQNTFDPEALVGPVFGYYTAETLSTTEPYDLERRDDYAARYHEVFSVKGTVEAGLEESEWVKGDIEFGINVKQPLKEIPFAIANIPRGDGQNFQRATLWVNSVQQDGQELTCVRTSPFTGLVVLPETVPAGTRLNLRMDFATRALYKRNYAFLQMNRFGWMPFVRFSDFVDEFELTIKTPAKYTILGIGHKVSERREGDVLITEWKADNPVVFPTLIFGKYRSATPRFDAKKLDGTVIPVAVHVDEVSMHQLDIDVSSGADAQEFVDASSAGARGIRGNQLRPIAEQAANAINLYAAVSGLDYPYGALNLVNDPAPALYGQAPSSLIYLGSWVFRGEGTMAGDTLIGGGGTGVSKFLKSVVAHEVGHQWWGSRISNANQRNYWFVETLAEYFSAIYLENVHGRKAYEEQVEEWRANILNTNRKSSVQDASALWPGEGGFSSYQSAVYNKGPYAFHILRETFGDEKFFAFLKQFSQELCAKREIVTRDIQQAAEKALGGFDEHGDPYYVDLDWFFDQWIRGTGIPQLKFDYTVRETEDRQYLVEGTIRQRVVVGNHRDLKIIEGKTYRGIVDITVQGKKGREYSSRILIEGAETPFHLKVSEKPIEVTLNKQGGMLAHDVVTDAGDW
jgi:hypothetical protein